MLKILDFVAQPSQVKDLNLEIIQEVPIGPLGHSHYRCYVDERKAEEISQVTAFRFNFSIESNMMLFCNETDLIEMLKLATEKLVGAAFDRCEIVRYDYPKTTSYYPVYGSDYLYLDVEERKHFRIDPRELCRFRPISSDPGVWLAIYEMTIGFSRIISLGSSIPDHESITDVDNDTDTDNESGTESGSELIDEEPPLVISPYRDDGITSFHGAAIYDISFIGSKERKFIDRLHWRIKKQNFDGIGFFEKTPDRYELMNKLLPAWNLEIIREVKDYCYVASKNPRGFLGMSGNELTHWLNDAYNRIIFDEQPITMIKWTIPLTDQEITATKTGVKITSANNGTLAIHAKSLDELELVLRLIGYK